MMAEAKEQLFERVLVAFDASPQGNALLTLAAELALCFDSPLAGLFIEDESAESPVSAASHEMLKDKIEKVLQTLTFREREIIKLRYGIGDGYTYTLEEVGRIFKVTRERVRQIEAKAVMKLQHPIRARKLAGFLESSGL